MLFFSGEGDNIRVYVRVRPPDKHLETDLDATPCLEVTSGNTVVLQSKPDPKSFSFDHVADINTTQVFIICLVVLMSNVQSPAWSRSKDTTFFICYPDFVLSNLGSN